MRTCTHTRKRGITGGQLGLYTTRGRIGGYLGKIFKGDVLEVVTVALGERMDSYVLRFEEGGVGGKESPIQ